MNSPNEIEGVFVETVTEWIEYHCTEETDLIQFLRDKAEEENEE